MVASIDLCEKNRSDEYILATTWWRMGDASLTEDKRLRVSAGPTWAGDGPTRNQSIISPVNLWKWLPGIYIILQ